MADRKATKPESRIDLLERRTMQARAVLLTLAAALDGNDQLNQDAVADALSAATELLSV